MKKWNQNLVVLVIVLLQSVVMVGQLNPRTGPRLSKDGKVMLGVWSRDSVLVIPEGVEVVEKYGGGWKKIVIPSTLKRMKVKMRTSEFVVAEGNTVWCSRGGHLYTKDGKTMVSCAIKYGGEVNIVIPEGTESVEYSAILFNLYNDISRIIIKVPRGKVLDVHYSGLINGFMVYWSVRFLVPKELAEEYRKRGYGNVEEY